MRLSIYQTIMNPFSHSTSVIVLSNWKLYQTSNFLKLQFKTLLDASFLGSTILNFKKKKNSKIVIVYSIIEEISYFLPLLNGFYSEIHNT
ncbi:hypothetical protein BpHYR1_012070 [Brachionus plicatilis]|uniref:Uncharacterized protein n=1 Tax=Brachionus plicatilis TaxID=10195 RepID=A0A3M7SSB2_BRAPC|nr:hypothetical protein BpHYR1_012070 [Brachionus plicatilis]